MENNKRNSHISYGWILFVVLLIVLYSTNPSESKFTEYLKTEIIKEAHPQDEFERALFKIFAGPTAYLTGLTTTRTNYYLFSTYEISIFGEKRKYVGIFNHYYEINAN